MNSCMSKMLKRLPNRELAHLHEPTVRHDGWLPLRLPLFLAVAPLAGTAQVAEGALQAVAATWLLPSKGARLAAAHAVGPRPLSGHLGAAKISSFSTSAKRNTGSAMAPESVTSAKRGPNLSLSGQAWGDEGPESVTLYGESAGGSGGSRLAQWKPPVAGNTGAGIAGGGGGSLKASEAATIVEARTMASLTPPTTSDSQTSSEASPPVSLHGADLDRRIAVGACSTPSTQVGKNSKKVFLTCIATKVSSSPES
eukprot:CAMPEP_0177370796 /NCGR_PEP_ID=MMETSP0368-20130122/42169_1 /TAXON_ID=447022 ORGANISM="Scrippsiella hangoei-like, Strain SHHI-4" /NCGR_SAMPLE_ID=MMETSP0368 /ASSEMBLY_ACC=CAM_ASM_000363 /LENGTH=253 /DNA_ID=CAMNT_0018834057 /DNA_START=282 /DNA_END=1045 /DNA_ORIENTATION=-